MAHEPGHIAFGPEGVEFLESLGVDINGLLAGAGGTDRSPEVFMGTTTRRTQQRGVRENARFARSGTRSVDDLRTRDEAVADFYSWDDAKVRDFQERAFSAGLYGTSDRSKIRWGDPTDADTFNIWSDRVDAAAGFWSQNRKVTPWDALDMAAQGNTGLDGAGGQGLSATNPLDFQALARQEGTAGLGRGLTDDELGRVTGALQATEAPFLGAGGSVSPPGGAALREVAEQQVRGLDATRFDSRVAVKVASVIQQMMEGKMPSHNLPGEGG